VSWNDRLDRFTEEVVARGAFHTRPLPKLAAWTPILATMESAPVRILEIGAYEGFTTCYLLWRLPEATVTCIDTFAGSPENRRAGVDLSQLEDTFDANVAIVDASRVRKLVGDSRRMLLELLAEGARYDLVYVDGSHLALDVLVDAALAWQLLDEDGTMIFDDYTWTVLGDDPLLRPGTAIDAFLSVVEEEKAPLFEGRQIAVRKTRPVPAP
jgi:predicted O-methyltransferase YrrM